VVALAVSGSLAGAAQLAQGPVITVPTITLEGKKFSGLYEHWVVNGGIGPWHHLRDLLLDIGGIEPIRHYDERFLAIRTPDVRARIEAGDDSWMAMVPAEVADTIKSERLFGYGAARTAS